MAQAYGDSVIKSVTPTITAGAYLAGDQIGAVQTLDVGYTGRPNASVLLQSVTIIDAASQNAEMDIVFWSSAPTDPGDNNPASYSDAQVASKCLGVVQIETSRYSTLAVNSVASEPNVGLLLAPDGSNYTVYATVVSRGTPTYTAINDLTFKYGFARDK